MAYLSIIVPIYKVERYLDQCIKSIMTQSFKDLEIILVDDGSPDNCGEICDRYASIDKRIKVLHKKNGGLVSARKAGLEIATSPYVTYVDGDDWIEKNMYEDMISEAKKTSADIDIIVEGFIIDKENVTNPESNLLSAGLYTGPNLEFLYNKMLLWDSFYKPGLYPIVWNKIFKTSLLREIQMAVPDGITMGEDVAVTYKYLLACNSCLIIDRMHYHYRINPDSMTKKYDSKYFDHVRILLEYMMKSLPLDTFGIRRQLAYYALYLICIGCNQEYEPRNYSAGAGNVKKIRTSLECNDWWNLNEATFDDIAVDKSVKAYLLAIKNHHFLRAKIYFLFQKAKKIRKMI